MTHTPTAGEIAAGIKDRLRSAGISHDDAAAALGITRSTLNRRLNGHRPLQSTDLLTLAVLLGTTIEDLVTVRTTAA